MCMASPIIENKALEEFDDVGDPLSPLGSEWLGGADWTDLDLYNLGKADGSESGSESQAPVLQPVGSSAVLHLKSESFQQTSMPMRTTPSNSREQWRELHNRVKNFSLFGGHEDVSAKVQAPATVGLHHQNSMLSRASSSHPASTLFDGEEGMDGAEFERTETEMNTEAREVSAKLTDILVAAEVASRATMQRMFDDFLARMWLQFHAINVIIKLGLQALSFTSTLQPIVVLHHEEDCGRMHVQHVQRSGLFTIQWYGFADQEQLARQQVVKQQLAAFQSIEDECEVRMDVLRTGVSSAFLEWQRRTNAAWRLQFWVRHSRLRRQLQATAESDREGRMKLLAQMAMTVEHQGVVNMDYKTYQEGVLRPQEARRKSRAASSQRSEPLVDPEALEQVRAMRRKQARQLEKDIATLEADVGMLKATMRKLHAKQYKLHRATTNLAHETGCLRDQLAADHEALRKVEAKLKGLTDLSREISRLRSENATLEILIRAVEKECEAEKQRVGAMEQTLRHRREIKQSRLEATQRSAQKRKARLEHAHCRLRVEIAQAEDSALQLLASQEVAANKLQQEEETALKELQSCEAERDALQAELEKKQRSLKKQETREFFPGIPALESLSYTELWQITHAVHLLHDAVCAAICSHIICSSCKEDHAFTVLLPCEHPQLCAGCAQPPLPSQCGTCGSAVVGCRPLLVADAR
eukprot:GGOE01037355.1.p1 GENE.GGOE01037355.1~~GGOE01037355.1.p1  ORF type:complete len:699 (-),score=165.71 GGOE01037355.1:297-2393(-)